MGTGEWRGGETESVTVETTTDCPGIEQTIKRESRIKESISLPFEAFPIIRREGVPLTIQESTARLLDRGECPDLQENVGAASEPSWNLRPTKTRRLPERLRDYVVNFLWGT